MNCAIKEEAAATPFETLKHLADGKNKKISKEGTCAICANPGSKSCSACHLVSYCSSEHQKIDWSNHKKSCCPFILKENEQFGRHLVAARKLKPGMLIIEESPMFTSPRGLVDEFDTPICLSCCDLMEEEKAEYRCSKCKWPTCCWTCEQHKYHAENECKIFAEKKISYPPLGEYAVYVTYKVIEIIRGVLIKDRCPEMWNRIMDLQHISELGQEKMLFKNLSELRKNFGVEDLGTEEDWCRVLRVLNVNSLSMEGRRGSNSPSFTGFLFTKSSMLAHSCAPNCWWGVSVFPNYKIHVRTTVEIQKGEVLSIPYSYLYNAFGTHKRQELIQDDAEFICKCKRCLDPTELGSFTSGLMCTSCNIGYSLPKNPLDVQSEWTCQHCNANYDSEEIKIKMEFLITQLEECDTLMEMEKFISENKEVRIHPNHWLITEAEDIICRERARNSWTEREELTLQDRDAHILFCTHLLSVKNLVAPGLSLERARLLNHLARAKFERLEFLIRSKQLTDLDDVSTEVDVIYILYEEALQFYINDPTETPITEQCGLRARTIISDMNVLKTMLLPSPQIDEETDNLTAIAGSLDGS